MTAVALVVMALLVFIQPMGLEILDAATGSRVISGWDEFWDPDPELAAAAETRSSRTIPVGAGDFLRERRAEDGPFRYAG